MTCRSHGKATGWGMLVADNWLSGFPGFKAACMSAASFHWATLPLPFCYHDLLSLPTAATGSDFRSGVKLGRKPNSPFGGLL